MSDPLIRTKLRFPFIRPSLVPRPRLRGQIAQGLRGPLMLITAPAGFGKTTLAAACAAECGMPVAWLSLDKDDNQPETFLNYLIAALHGADAAVGGEAAQLMGGMSLPPSEAVLTSLINDLDAAGREMALVLDDYHFISSQAVHADLAFFLDHHPSTCHLVIVTRSDPPLPLARLRARGQVAELRAADLRFTEEEAAQFLHDVMGLNLDAASVTALEERTEGWIAGLQMAAVSMRDRKDIPAFIAGFSGTNRHILDYLMEEILAAQSPEIQRFLLQTSLLERLSAPLCDAILRDEDNGSQKGSLSLPPSAAVLEYLERENLFLVSLDEERVWFRYHRLFADLLQARLTQAQPETITLLHRRASAWLEQNGLVTEAVHHLLEAHEAARAADLIERYGPACWAENDVSVVRMADQLPPEMLVERPRIGLYRAWLLINQGNIDKAFPLLIELSRQLAQPELPPETRWIRTIVDLALAFLGRPDGSLSSAPLPEPRLLDEIPAGEIVLRDAADILYGMALSRWGEIDRATEFSLERMQAEKLRREGPVIPTLGPFLATMYLFQGRLHAAAALCREFLEPIKLNGLRVSTAGNMDVILGDVLYEWNSLEEAENMIRDGLRANEPWGNIMTDAFGLLALSRVLQARGDFAGAMQVVEKFETRMREPTRPVEFEEPYRTLRVRVRLAAGDLSGAGEWADQAHLRDDYLAHREDYRLLEARIRLAQGRYILAEELLSGASAHAADGNRIASRLESELLLAAALGGQGRWNEAFMLVEVCLALAELEGYMRAFVDIGQAMRELLQAYLKSDTPRHELFARKVLSAFPPLPAAAPASPSSGGLIEPLSARELEVLCLMAAGKTNAQIAGQLIVAAGTVKAHAASIYRKLDAANRGEAVARARDLGLLP